MRACLSLSPSLRSTCTVRISRRMSSSSSGVIGFSTKSFTILRVSGTSIVRAQNAQTAEATPSKAKPMGIPAQGARGDAAALSTLLPATRPDAVTMNTAFASNRAPRRMAASRCLSTSAASNLTRADLWISVLFRRLITASYGSRAQGMATRLTKPVDHRTCRYKTSVARSGITPADTPALGPVCHLPDREVERTQTSAISNYKIDGPLVGTRGPFRSRLAAEPTRHRDSCWPALSSPNSLQHVHHGLSVLATRPPMSKRPIRSARRPASILFCQDGPTGPDPQLRIASPSTLTSAHF